jgi:hypothetical protein
LQYFPLALETVTGRVNSFAGEFAQITRGSAARGPRRARGAFTRRDFLNGGNYGGTIPTTAEFAIAIRIRALAKTGFRHAERRVSSQSPSID